MSQPLPNSQQHHAGTTAAGTAAPEQATRWLLGRIKDGSHKALLLQQAPNMTHVLPWGSSTQSQRPAGSPAPTGALHKTGTPRWPQTHPQAPNPPPGQQGICNGQQQLHNQSDKPSTQNSSVPFAAPSSTPPAVAKNNSIPSSTAGNRMTGTQAPNRYHPVQSQPGPPPLSGPPGAPQSGPCLPPWTAHSSSHGSKAILAPLSSQPRGPSQPNYFGKPSAETGKQTRLVLRTPLPIHWQQQQAQQQQQHQQQAQPQQHQQQQVQHQQQHHQQQAQQPQHHRQQVQQQQQQQQRQHHQQQAQQQQCHQQQAQQQHQHQQQAQQQHQHQQQAQQQHQHQQQAQQQHQHQQHVQQQHQHHHQQAQQHQYHQQQAQHHQYHQQQGEQQQHHQQQGRQNKQQQHQNQKQGQPQRSQIQGQYQQQQRQHQPQMYCQHREQQQRQQYQNEHQQQHNQQQHHPPQQQEQVDRRNHLDSMVRYPSTSNQPQRQNLTTDGACPRSGWEPTPEQRGDASPLDLGKPLKQQRCATGVSGGAASDCSVPSFSHPKVGYVQTTATAAAGPPTTEEGLPTSSSSSSSPLVLPQHGALFGSLSPEQAKVVNAPPHASVCVLAGPGAGKTSTITARIVRLLLRGCRPLAALTFTRKSATELERRVRGGLEGVLKDRCTSGCVSSWNVGMNEIGERDLFVGTFHSFFVRLLKSYGAYVGVPRDFRVLNQFEQLSILRGLIDTEKRAEAMRLGNSGAKGISAALRSSLDIPEVSSEEDDGCSEEEGEATSVGFQGVDSGSFSSSTSKEAEELRKRIRSMKFIPELLERERAAGSVLFRLFCQYDRHLRGQQPPLLDFTDLTVKALKLLEPPVTRAELGAQWPYLVVDEFQDTNSNQFKFICLLALQRPPNAPTTYTTTGSTALSNTTLRRGGVTVVGDDDQSIYKWRGTHTGIFHEFKRNFPDYQEFFLACNYRSVPAVVHHSLSLVSFNWPFRISKALYSSQGAPRAERLPRSCFPKSNASIDAGGERDGSLVRGTAIEDNKGPARGHVHGAFLPSQSLEAQYILRYILCLKQHHSLRWDDFAVLCRTNSALLDIQNLLMNPRIQRAACSASSPFSINSVHGNSEDDRDSLGIGDPNKPVDPAVLFPAVKLADLELPAGGLPLTSTSSKRSGGAEVFLRPDVLDLLSYLRLAIDPHHDASFIRVLNRPPRRVGAKTLLALKRIQSASANRSTNGADIPRSIVEMPWENVPWAPGAQRGPRDTSPPHASLFDALCRLLHCAGVKNEDMETPPAELAQADAVAAAEAARLRANQVESLASFAKAVHRLRSVSASAVPVKALLEVMLGPLGLGEFFAHRRLVQRSRRGGAHDSEGATGAADSAVPQEKNPDTGAADAAAGTKQRRSKRKAAAADSTQPSGDITEAGTPDAQTEASLQKLSKVYGSDMFADVLGLLRAAEAYSPNWQQATAADCIVRLLRDANAGRFLQQKVANAVTLSTIHQAKGLEWQVVIVARANEGTLPMGLGGSQPLADFVSRLISSFAEKPPNPETLRQAEATIVRQASGNEQHFHLMEERRVCYVALTRARRFLLLTAPLADKANHPLNPSRFFKEAGLVSQWQPQLPAPAVPAGAKTNSDENQSAQEEAAIAAVEQGER
ncbi:dihydroorotate dehydrogenase, putative [Eimeria brunetti]|uniref:DNA 3'-5' helicase n=1 Tax=Eimeria brunetti TaxID=51314 RepID=U6LIU1_9EIME|nr:dihydroorotate dehydrogenase, putative [Eimeria brunetti]